MSYILDALKKSEAERTRGVVPTLLAPQQTALRGGVIGWLVVGALLVNAGLLAAWMYWPTKKDSTSPPTNSVSAVTPPATGAYLAPVQTQPASNAPAYPTASASASMPAGAAYADNPPTPVAAMPPTTRVAQPDANTIDSGQPTIITPRSEAAAAPVPSATNANASRGTNDATALHYEFSTHFYASDPSKRAVTLNGRRYMEGDLLDPGVRIKEITETGVVLDVGGQTVPLDVLQDWR
jgi:general secretion pathway protein B